VGAVITETYISAGILATSTEFSNNGKLEIRTITYYNGTPASPGAGWALVSTSVQNTDGTNGIPTRIYRFAKGVGKVSRGVETKFSGALVLTTETWLGDTLSTNVPAALTGEYSRDYREADGYVLWTLAGAVGSGVINDNTQNRYANKLHIRTVVSIGTAVHADGEIEFSADTRDGYTIYTSRGVSGSGRFATSTSSLQGGAVTRTTIRFIDTDDTAKPSGAVTATDTEQQDGYSIISETYTSVPVAGGGVNGYATEELSYKLNGSLTITTRTAYNASAPMPSGGGYALIHNETTSGDGFTINTRSWASGSGNIDSEYSLRLDGHLKYTTYRSLNVIPSGTVGTLVKAQTDDGEGYTLYTYTYLEVVTATLTPETSSKLNGALTITTLRKIGSAPTAITGAKISSRVDEGEGYSLFTDTYASGSGNIDSEFSDRLAGKLRYTTYRSLNIAPTGTSGTLVKSQTEDGDGYTIFTYTYVTIVGGNDLTPETTVQLGGKLTLTTYRRIGSAPPAPGTANAAKVASRVDEGEGYSLFSDTYASGTGDIGDAEVRYKFNNTLTITTKRALNVPPTSPGGSNLSLISTDQDAGNGYVLYTYTWVSGSGFIDATTDNRSDGSVLYTVTSLNVAVDGTPPSGSTLINEDTEPGEGYRIFTRQFYKKPPGYSVPVNLVVKKPGVQGGGDEGLTPLRLPEIKSVSATAVVTFVDTVPTLDAVTPISSGVTVYEYAEYTDGKTPEFLYDSTYYPDHYRPAGSYIANNTPYKGRDASKIKITFFGAVDQHGQTLTFSSEAEVYFRSGTYTVYKVTKVTGVL